MLTLTVVWVLAVIAGFLALAYVDAAGGWWSGAIALALAAAWEAHLLPPLLVIVLAVLLVVLAIPLNVPPLRRALVSDGVLGVFRRILPAMTSTEREAIEAGTVGWDGELFSGRPDWKALLALPAPKRSLDDFVVDALLVEGVLNLPARVPADFHPHVGAIHVLDPILVPPDLQDADLNPSKHGIGHRDVAHLERPVRSLGRRGPRSSRWPHGNDRGLAVGQHAGAQRAGELLPGQPCASRRLWRSLIPIKLDLTDRVAPTGALRDLELRGAVVAAVHHPGWREILCIQRPQDVGEPNQGKRAMSRP